MTLATRCNACTTVFRVVRDQLRVSDGWVRCGRCNAVFNATDDLFELAELPASTGAATDPSASADRSRQRLDEVLDDLAEHRRQLQQSAPAAPSVWSRPTAPRPAEPLQDEFSQADEAGWDDSPEPPLDDLADPAPTEDDPDPALDEADGDADADFEPAEAPLAPPALAAWRDDGGYEREVAAIDGDDGDDRDDDGVALQPPAPAEQATPTPTPTTESDAPGLTLAEPAPADTLDDGSPAAIVAWHRDDLAPAHLGPAIFADGAPAATTGAADATAVQAGSASATTAAIAPAAVPSFIRRADRAAFWHSRQVRRSLATAAGMLGLLLLLQAGRAGRDLLAAHIPALQPALQALCDTSACEITPLRRIDRISVDSAGLGLVEGAPVYRLQLLLHNRADTAVLAPALELTLNDAQGRLLARRVLQGAELGLSGPVLAAGQELPLQVMLSAREQRIAGYNIELFYP